MICPNCKGELSKVWQPKHASDAMAIAPVRWNCGTCGESFSSQQMRPRAKREIREAPAQPELV
jgi:transcriptional regulator NrdR family protein